MLLDLLIILIMAFFVILGVMQGATKQVISLIRIAIAAIIATKLYVYYGKLIAASNIFGFFVSELVAWIFIYILAYILINILKKLIRDKLLGKKSLKDKIEEKVITGSLDKIFGGILSGFKTLIIIVFMIFLLDVLLGARTDKKDKLFPPEAGPPMAEKTKKTINNSIIASNITKYNPFKKSKVTKAFSDYARLQNNPKALRKVAKQESVKKLLENKKIKGLLKDKKLNKAIADKDYVRLFQNEKILEIMRDKELINLLLSVDFETVFDEEDAD